MRLDHLLSRETWIIGFVRWPYPRSSLPGFQNRALFSLFWSLELGLSLADESARLFFSIADGMQR